MCTRALAGGVESTCDVECSEVLVDGGDGGCDPLRIVLASCGRGNEGPHVCAGVRLFEAREDCEVQDLQVWGELGRDQEGLYVVGSEAS